MNTHLPPRLRALALFVPLALAALAIGGAVHGWKTIPDVLPIVIVVGLVLFLWGARDTDVGALIRHQADERQAVARLKVQALVGRVLSLAVAAAFIAATVSRTTLWPWAAMLGLVAVCFLAGWLIYGENRWRTPSQ